MIKKILWIVYLFVILPYLYYITMSIVDAMETGFKYNLTLFIISVILIVLSNIFILKTIFEKDKK